MWKEFLIVTLFLAKGNAKECAPYIVDNDVVACICNATYCDTFDHVPKSIEPGTFYWYVTNKEGLRMKMSQGKIGNDLESPSNVTLTINRTEQYQKMLGFGGAFSDSTGINIRSLSPATQDQLIRTYYSPETGSKYTIGRIPIGGTDFSTRLYSYDDHVNDSSLIYFSLAPEDYQYKIPFARKALELNSDLKFFASAWSAPGWMKTNGIMDGYGFLEEKYYQTYANYLALFVDEYKKNGIDMWAVTTGNEPTIDLQVNVSNVITMGWTPDTMAEWVANYMGPTLANKGTVVLALDDDRELLPWYVEPLFRNKKASKYTVGTAVHWYFENEASITTLDKTHEEFPDKILLLTEASIIEPIWGTPNFTEKAWAHGEKYFKEIMKYVNHWSVGFVDWNLALNEEGGPSWVKNYLDAGIIVNPEKDEFYKLPIFYAMAHFSRFVDRGSARISIAGNKTIKSTAFITPSEETVVILYNSNNFSTSVTLADEQMLQLELSPYSMNTIIYK
ncbi:lysosomal acid glucosylceramidase-like isoform X1 [Hylaeus volcanicus]|uniref:lysosomal acid glucosylceramidase-like isoform X1 n=1 Tax=Hylaeus volcanicus TaxID=313075 RepID=UPI0023B82B84|nr:lysosomal acid glucosylceramidase-like isoform X1 [Hylaeus volcanicus]